MSIELFSIISLIQSLAMSTRNNCMGVASVNRHSHWEQERVVPAKSCRSRLLVEGQVQTDTTRSQLGGEWPLPLRSCHYVVHIDCSTCKIAPQAAQPDTLTSGDLTQARYAPHSDLPAKTTALQTARYCVIPLMRSFTFVSASANDV